MVEISKSYNLLWMSPKFAEKGFHPLKKFYEPLPPEVAHNILKVAKRNPSADVRLWVDSERLTTPQTRWLKRFARKSRLENLGIQDLREIPQYDRSEFYREPDTNAYWREDKHSLIWRQVDAARILVLLNDQADQRFYADADITNLKVDSKEIQRKINKHGIIISGDIDFMTDLPWYENQILGFSRERQAVLQGLYNQTVEDCLRDKINGFWTLENWLREIIKQEGLNPADILFNPKLNGTQARHLDEAC